ncbi:MAG: hypothetical protein MHM6MM_007200 [Cercozoa sp. M6MM]
MFEDDGITVKKGADDVFVLKMARGENRVNVALVTSLNKALDKVQEAAAQVDGKPSLVLTGDGKFFSNGLDTGEMTQLASEGRVDDFMAPICKLLSRILVFPMPTVAAVNGHAFGAGLFLALVCDYRCMRTQRGFLCLPETRLGMPFSWGFARLVHCKLPNKTVLRDAALTSKRYGSTEALQVQLIDHECDIERLLPAAMALAAKLAPCVVNGDAFQQMKQEIFMDAFLALANYKHGDSLRYARLLRSKL